MFPTGKGGHAKIENVLGSYRAISRWTEKGKDGAQIELAFEAAVFARFDIREEWDLDAEDWRFGFPLSYRDGDLTWKLHVYHLTSHLGDEYTTRTGRRRISYHLEEASLGLSWTRSSSTRLYAELGVALYTGGTEAENGRVQLGLEWKGERWSEEVAPFLALDLQTRNEIDWRINKTLVAGLRFRGEKAKSGFRLGLEYFHGRDPQTQFLDDFLTYVAVSFSVEGW